MGWHHDAFCDWAPIHPHQEMVAMCRCGHSQSEHQCERPSGRRNRCMNHECKCELYSGRMERREGMPAEEPTASARLDPSEAA